MTRDLILVAAALMASRASGQPAEVVALRPDAPVEREIQAGEAHAYRLPVVAGQFVNVKAAQLGSDVAIRLTQPDGKRFAEVDRVGYEGFEDLPWIATATGDCTIEIRARNRFKSGRYRIEASVSTPTEQDRSRVAAFVASWIDAEALMAKGAQENFREAYSKFQFATSEWRKAGDLRWEAYAWSEQARVLEELGDLVKARQAVEQSLVLRRGLDERFSLSVSLNGMGRMLSALGEPKRAAESYEEALAIRREVGDRPGQAAVLTNMGALNKRVSNYPKAIEYLTEALKIRREVGDRNGEAVTLGGLGDIHFVSGDFQAALDLYLEAWKLRVGRPDRKAEAHAAFNLGSSYFAMGQSNEAQQYWNRAAAIYRELGDTLSLGSVLYAKGMDQARHSQNTAALESFEEALSLHRKGSSAAAIANDLAAACDVLRRLGQRETARIRGSEGVELSRKAGYQTGLGASLGCLGRVQLADGDYEGAKARLTEALAVFRAVGGREPLAELLTNLAEMERGRGNLAEALRYAEESTGLMETGRTQVTDPNLRASYRAARFARMDLPIDLLMRMHAREPQAGHAERAFNLTERSRGRSLAEMISEKRAELRQELSAAQREREDQLLAAISGIQKDLFRQDVPVARQQELKTKLATAERELDLFQADLRRGGNRYAAGQYAEALDAGSIRRQMLDAHTVLIEYELGDSQSYAWALTEAGVTSAVLPGRKQLEQSVASYRKQAVAPVSALTASAALERLDVEGRKLYQMLLAPLEAALESKTRVVIVPDGALAYLPFEALPGRTRMIERFSISYAPSASTLAALRDRDRQRPAPQRTLLAFADPSSQGRKDSSPALAAWRERGFAFTPLPNARVEVAGIRSLFRPENSHIYLGAEAREQSLKSEKLESYRYVHFAAHGYFDEEQPSRSGIVLSADGDEANDGVLQAAEIMRLPLNADLVTLSACQTGLGEVLAGEGVMGLTRAFFYAGAQSVVVSLWSVNDAATAELMKHFYVNLKAGMSRDEAMRRAKLKLIATPNSPWRHPYFWAPFVFVGDAGWQR